MLLIYFHSHFPLPSSFSLTFEITSCQEINITVKNISDGLEGINSIEVKRKEELGNIGDTNNRGGIAVEPDNTLRLYGNVHHEYALSEAVPVNKLTRLKFFFTQLEHVLGVGICLYQTYDFFLVETPKYCFLLKNGVISKASDYFLVQNGFPELEGEAVNLARDKPTKQSSTNPPGDAAHAVDGKIDRILNYDAWEFNTVTSTKADIQPWWEVDLEEDRIIRRVVLHKRVERYGDELKDFTISLYNGQGDLTATETYSSVAEASIGIVFNNVISRKLRITLNGGTARVLCLAEVQVFGAVFDFDVPIGKIFNIPPEVNFNRIAFVQDRSEEKEVNVDLEEASSVITGLSFSFNTPTGEELKVSLAWHNYCCSVCHR